ncbi:MAG: hypothetical protein IT366_08650 [Candidatus Hydrogenedentes bacterium]|nr:hypothetical protein [Candidatus Hydrogenedentota bacterium]
MRYIITFMLCVLTLSCQRSSYYEMDYWAKSYVPPKNQTVDSDDDIRESVFRYQMHNNRSVQQQKTHAFFLSLEDWRDPSDEFMDRFARNPIKAKKFSACETANETPLGVHDKETKLPGIVLVLRTLERTGDTEALVSGGYFEGGDNMAGSTFELKFKNGRWTVTKASDLTYTQYTGK